MGTEEVQRPNGASAQAQWHAVHGGESQLDGPRSESGPAIVVGAQHVVDNGLAVSVAVDARPLIHLDLEQLEDAHRITRRSDEL